MKSVLKNIGLVSVLLVMGFLLFTTPAFAQQTARQSVCEGLGATGQTAGCTTTSGPSVQSIVTIVINVLTWIVGIVAVIMIIIGGLKYVTSSGDSANVTSAKNTILYAVIGLVIVILAQVIVRFVVNKVA